MQKTISLFLILLVSIANLSAMCTDDHGRVAEIHLIYDSCNAHACNGDQTHECDTRQCNHNLCDDQIITSSNRVSRYNDSIKLHSSVIINSASCIFQNQSISDNTVSKKASLITLPRITYLQVLRI